MTGDSQTRATELLKELGLKEYESKCLVALTRLPEATAKQLGEVTDVPRTRVYDAIRVLEARGLVEVQHSNPRKYRAVSVDEATSLLAQSYDERIETVHELLESLPPLDAEGESAPVGEIWSLSNHDAINARFVDLIEDVSEEVILVVGDVYSLSEEVYDALDEAAAHDVTVIVGVVEQGRKERLDEELPGARVFASDLPWFPRDVQADGALVTRVLLVDHDTLVVGSRAEEGKPEEAEQAVVGSGTANGIVVTFRKLLRTGLLEGSDGGA